jgi:hypothetical protein
VLAVGQRAHGDAVQRDVAHLLYGGLLSRRQLGGAVAQPVVAQVALRGEVRGGLVGVGGGGGGGGCCVQTNPEGSGLRPRVEASGPPSQLI